MRRKKSPRTKLIEEADRLLFEILCLKRGKRCEICGGRQKLGLFHIMPKGRYPRIRFHKRNLLIAGWFCCHYIWHHDYMLTRDRIVPRVKELRGNTYEDKLRVTDLGAKSITMVYLSALVRALKRELKSLEGGWQSGRV